MITDPLRPPLSNEERFAQLISQARSGSDEAKGLLLETCRKYLRILASRELPPRLHAKVTPSDIVQETMLEAMQCFPAFAGQSQHELLAWIRRVLLNNVTDAVRHYVDADKRSIHREVSLERAAPEESPAHDPPAESLSARTAAVLREEQQQLEQAIASLPCDYALVITLHHREGLSFVDIAARMGRSAEAVRKLWARAIAQLQQQLEPDDDAS